MHGDRRPIQANEMTASNRADLSAEEPSERKTSAPGTPGASTSKSQLERSQEFYLCWYDAGDRDVEGSIDEIGPRSLFVRIGASGVEGMPDVGDKITLLIQGTRRYTHEVEGCVRSTTTSPSSDEQRTARAGFELEVFDPEALESFLAVSRAHLRSGQTSNAPPSTAKV